MHKIKLDYKMDELRFVEFQLTLLFNYPKFQLNNTDIRVLAYVFLYGSDSERKLLEDNIFKSQQSLNNSFSKLRKLSLLKGERQYRPTKLVPELNSKIKLYKPEPCEFTISWK